MMLQETSTGDNGPVRIAIYTRKSNDENLVGEVTSIENQRSCCRSYIESQKVRGWQEYPEAFDDPAESGKDLNRPSMKRLLERAKEGKLQGIIVYKLDRLTRNSRDFHNLWELFEQHKVALISATESIDTRSPQGRLMVYIMVQFAQYDRELDVERARDLHFTRARKGLWSAGLPPLGYDIKDKSLVINNEEADLVRKIFDLYPQYGSTIRVAEELNRMGYRRKLYRTQDGRLYGGKLFDPDTVARTLRRKAYMGIITNGRTGQEFAGQHQPIISPEIFEKAQQLLDAHDRREGLTSYSPNRHGFLLKGLVRCGHCNSAVVGYARPKGKKLYRYYRCLAHMNGLPVPCPVKNIGAEKLEEFVVEKLATVGFDRPFLDSVVGYANEFAKTAFAEADAEKSKIDQRLKEINGKLSNLVNVSSMVKINEAVAAEMDRLQTARRNLDAKRTEIEASLNSKRQIVYDANVVHGALERFARFIRRIPIEQQIQTLSLLVKQVVLGIETIGVETYELPIYELDKALQGRLEGPRPDITDGRPNKRNGEPGSGNGDTDSPDRGLNPALSGVGGQFQTDQPTEPDHRQLRRRTRVAELGEDWRGQLSGHQTALNPPIVPPRRKTHFIPPFRLSWTVRSRQITNGEKVIEETVALSDPNAGMPKVPTDGKSRNPIVIASKGGQFQTAHFLEADGLKLRPGKDLLTCSGLPARFSQVAGGLILLHSLASDNRIAVPVGYPMALLSGEKAALAVRPSPYWKSERRKSLPQQGGDLASEIDPLLLEGCRTMRGLVREVKRRASRLCHGKDVRANIRARIYWLQRKGYRLEKIGQDLKLVPSVPTASQ